MNLAQLLEGPAIIKYKGQLFHSARTLDARFLQETFPIETSAFGPIDLRARQPAATATFQPVGEFDDDLCSILLPWTNPHFGQLVTPLFIWDDTQVDPGTNQLHLPAHSVRKGMPAMLGTFGTLPSGLDDVTLFYVGAPDADHLTFHTTQADAVAGTNAIALGSAGTGVSQMVEQEPLVIHTQQGNKVTFPVGAVTAMPELNFSALATLFGPVTFEFYRKNGVAWSEEDSLFSVSYEPINLIGPDRTKIPTKEYRLQWGNVAPFADFQTRGPLAVRFNLGTAPYETDQRGILSKKITGLTATITGQPSGMSEAQLAKYLDLQGAGTGRGVARTMQDFIITAVDGSVHARIYNAALQAAPQQFDATNPRAGTLEWGTARRFFQSGLVHPVFAIGTQPPTS